jgi:predicted Zn-dependent peptidase
MAKKSGDYALNVFRNTLFHLSEDKDTFEKQAKVITEEIAKAYQAGYMEGMDKNVKR